MEIADAKNFSISVDKDELAMIGETGAKYKYLSQEIAEHNSVIYSYSNVYNEFSTKPKSNIDIKKVVSLNSFFNEDRVLQNDNVDLYKSLEVVKTVFNETNVYFDSEYGFHDFARIRIDIA